MNDGFWLMDLQLFADDSSGEKTERATPRKRLDTRRKGQVFKSSDLSSAFILIMGAATVVFSFPYMVRQIADFSRLYLSSRLLEAGADQMPPGMFVEVAYILGKALLPVFTVCFVTALAVNLYQVGFLFTTDPLALNFSRLNPVEGFKQKFSKRALVELAKSLFKVGLTSYVIYLVFRDMAEVIPALIDMSNLEVFQLLKSVFLELTLKIGVLFVIIGVADYLYQRYEHEKRLRMSKYEVKQEYKQTEGDPLVKSRQRQKQREVAMQRMMQEVPKADVVITNPTHFAVALRYDAEKMAAPTVVAKGADLIALRIRTLAEENAVVIREDPPLARWLYDHVPIGRVVPPEMFQAIAEILAFVYKQKKKTAFR
jgi:flagellar biosynthetic protein FlhB